MKAFTTAILVLAIGLANVQAAKKCVQNYNIGQSDKHGLSCGPGKEPCVALLNEGKFINSPSKPVKCDSNKKVCQYADDSMLTVQCNQGTVTVQFVGSKNYATAQNHAQNAHTYFVSNQCTHPSKLHSNQKGDTLVVNCNALKPDANGKPTACNPDYAYNRDKAAVKNAFQCGPGIGKCVTVEGKDGEIVRSPSQPVACDPDGKFCKFGDTASFSVKCNQGTYKVDFGKKD
ncbi:uncharacterized protein FA14DRAFT_160592, partial [Meira miltonrushii]